MLPIISRRSVLSGSLALAGSYGLRVAPSQATVSSSGPPNGSLLIVGGGYGVDIQDALIRLSRGEGGVRTRWVYIPTAMTDEELRHDKPPGFAVGDMVTVMHTRDRSEADNAAYVGVENPVDFTCINSVSECIQRIVLAAPGSEPITEPQKLRLIDRREDRNHRSLDDLVFQGRHGYFEQNFGPVRLWV